MSVGHFRVQGYNIRLNVDSFRISTPTKLGLSIMGAYHPDGSEPIQIRVFNPLQALVETERSIFRLEYIEDNDEPNGPDKATQSRYPSEYQQAPEASASSE